MTDVPIIFSAPMVRAILDGRKTQTRRLLKPQPDALHGVRPIYLTADGKWQFRDMRWSAGDKLWVREAWRASSAHDNLSPADIPVGDGIEYLADPERFLTGRNRPAMFMPRWACRIVLEVTGVKVERLQDIDDGDAIAEGVMPEDDGYSLDGISTFYNPRATGTYEYIWDSINGPGAWDANPWVAAISFRRVEQREEY